MGNSFEDEVSEKFANFGIWVIFVLPFIILGWILGFLVRLIRGQHATSRAPKPQQAESMLRQRHKVNDGGAVLIRVCPECGRNSDEFQMSCYHCGHLLITPMVPAKNDGGDKTVANIVIAITVAIMIVFIWLVFNMDKIN